MVSDRVWNGVQPCGSVLRVGCVLGGCLPRVLAAAMKASRAGFAKLMLQDSPHLFSMVVLLSRLGVSLFSWI